MEALYMIKYEYKKCDGCHRMLLNNDKVTVVIPDVEICGKYRKNTKGFRLKLSSDGVDYRAAKIYCASCLDINNHFLEDK